uniref:Uncharacterized protein n=1 Tax=Fagus sylvatica TaxID=28930 RepID=A0A2N9H2J8_FAGSY
MVDPCEDGSQCRGGIREWRENDGQVAATEEDDDSSNSVVLVNSNR